MFYCEKCRIINNWPRGFGKSFGKCESCDDDSLQLCDDFHHSQLTPIVKREKVEKPLKTNEEILDLVTNYIKEKHRGQKRWDGSPYHHHPIAVSELAVDIYKTLYPYDSNPENLLLTRIVGLCHDLVEDTNVESEREVVDWLGSAEVTGWGILSDCKLKNIELSLTKLNKNYYDNYLDFVLASKEMPYSRAVKLADLAHNVSDLKKGSMKDKYLLAQHILWA